MDFEMSPKARDLCDRLEAFMDAHVYPNEPVYQQQLKDMGASVEDWENWGGVPIIEELKVKARAEGLWNLFLPESRRGGGLTNLEYAPLCEIMGRAPWSAEIFNCSAPDTGNMETLERYGTEAQKKEWMEPLLAGEIRSCFSMTEPDVASSDARNISLTIIRDGDEYVINGRKWWTSGSGDSRCKLFIVMGKSDPDGADPYRQQSMILVPRDTPGLTIKRMIPVFGFSDAPHGHGEIIYDNVRVPASNMLLGEGCGFEIAQGRLGPGRIHHCMRMIGQAEVALEKMCKRVVDRHPFGKPLSDQGVVRDWIAQSRIMIDQARLLTLNAADRMDKVGNKEARKEIGMIKVVAPNMAAQVIDWAIQAHGAAGISSDFGLSYAYARARAIRLADGPDEVHANQIARLELKKYLNR
ncbi:MULTISPECIES: acyl-CoA dehydrogenase family protein [Pacificibacter]|uniref:acyl-CoA dehydrogenase family protein n=1 Tax=Pacificibacter TaxID=1042323 RepID=UPI001C097AE6|nr:MULTISPECIES: acyl-CoA dehydrogenase family protein [Pacificibacter]MBU2937032.1 acyl-CoA dehydrogenase family protein [Pacificibacter marinus]MDO6616428.1 acyl-CoA dehydrogenase family protein [Pacificibacter sp. 1_MG-2023]